MSDDTERPFSETIMTQVGFYQQAIFGVERKKRRRKSVDQAGLQMNETLHSLLDAAYNLQISLWGCSGGQPTTLDDYKQAKKVWKP